MNLKTFSSLMITELHNFYLQKEEPNKSCLLALRSIIIAQDPNIHETQKYGMPCFCYYNKMFCYLWTDKKTGQPYILMVEGKHIDDPNLEEGNRSRMKILRIDSTKDLPLEIIESVIQKGLELYRTGVIKVKI